MLLEHKSDYSVIESSEKGGLFQHNPFSWSVMGTSFVHLDGLSEKGKRHDEVISGWLSKVTPEERRIFTDTLFGVIESTGAKTVTELTTDQFSRITAAVKAYSSLDRETKEKMYSFMKRLLSAIRH